MKIAICAMGATLDSKISFVFGRCPYFIIVDTQDKKNNFEAIVNPAASAGRGAGIAAAQAVVSKQVQAIVCQGLGPNAFSVLQTSGIVFYVADADSTIVEVVKQFRKGTLKKITSPTSGAGGPGRGRGRGGGWGRNRF